MKIDAQTGWYRGLGDLVVFSWIGESLNASGQSVEFYATDWRAEVLRMFQMSVTDDPKDAIVLHEGYEQCILKGLTLNDAQWIALKLATAGKPTTAGKLGIDIVPVRPRLNLAPYPREMGRNAGQDAILIFPECVWTPRTWPVAYFIALGRELQKAGYRVVFVTKERNGCFLMFPVIYDQSLSFIAGAIQSARMVIGNDSGPAHLAGTIGTPTIAIHGPTQGARIYGYMDNVISYSQPSLGCAGCHCLDPFPRGMSCQFGCHELYRTFPEFVTA